MPSSSTVFARSTRFLSIRWVMSGLPFDVGRWCARPCDGQLTPTKRSVGLLKCDACRRHTSCLLPRQDFGTSRFKAQYSSLADFAAVRNTVGVAVGSEPGSALVEHKISASPPKPDICALLLNDSLLGPPTFLLVLLPGELGKSDPAPKVTRGPACCRATLAA